MRPAEEIAASIRRCELLAPPAEVAALDRWAAAFADRLLATTSTSRADAGEALLMVAALLAEEIEHAGAADEMDPVTAIAGIGARLLAPADLAA